MKIIYALIYICILTDVIAQQTTVEIIVKDNSSSSILSAGLDPNATPGIDRDLGESELPPAPPEGIFYAKFISPDTAIKLGNGLLRDFRPGSWGENSHSHRIEFQSQSGYSKDVTFIWDLPSYVKGVIEDDFGLFKKEMQGKDSLLLAYNGLRSLSVKFTYNVSIGLQDAEEILLKEFSLEQNYPNPFNPSTNISYNLPQDGHVVLKVYDMLGREVAILEDRHKSAGQYTTHFDASSLSTGIYIYHLQAGRNSITKKMNLIK